MIQRLSIVLAQIKAGNTSENLLNEICQIYILCIEQRKLIKNYITIQWVIKHNGYYIYEF